MKKIALFFYVDNSHGHVKLGGAERRLSRIWDELETMGFETHVLLKVRELSPEVDEMYINALKYRKTRIRQFETYTKMLQYMINQKFDWICYTDSYRAMIPFLLGGTFLFSKRMMLNVTTYASQLKFLNKNQKLLFELVVRLSNHLDVLYPTGFECMKSKYTKKSITLTPGAFTDLDTFYPKEKQKKIVFLASLIEIKNPLLFVDAIHSIYGELKQYGYQVEICGSGPLQSEVIEKVIEYGCDDLISIHGNVDSYKFLPEAEIFVSIQNYNNYPSQSLLEAISSGCYIVASNEGDTKAIVKESFGTLCDLSAESIGNEILMYIQNSKDQKLNAIKAARAFALKEFTVDKSTMHYANLFK